MTFAFCVIVCSILAFIMGFLVCYLWVDKLREETRKEFLGECFDYCKNDVLTTEEVFNFTKGDSVIITEITEGEENGTD